jgi:hypothetical protein
VELCHLLSFQLNVFILEKCHNSTFSQLCLLTYTGRFSIKNHKQERRLVVERQHLLTSIDALGSHRKMALVYSYCYLVYHEWISCSNEKMLMDTNLSRFEFG